MPSIPQRKLVVLLRRVKDESSRGRVELTNEAPGAGLAQP